MRIFCKKRQENGPLEEKWQDRKSKRTRQKNKRRDRNEESNDSPEIPDTGGGGGGMKNIPSLPLGHWTRKAIWPSQVTEILQRTCTHLFATTKTNKATNKGKRADRGTKVKQYTIHYTYIPQPTQRWDSMCDLPADMDSNRPASLNQQTVFPRHAPHPLAGCQWNTGKKRRIIFVKLF